MAMDMVLSWTSSVERVQPHSFVPTSGNQTATLAQVSAKDDKTIAISRKEPDRPVVSIQDSSSRPAMKLDQQQRVQALAQALLASKHVEETSPASVELDQQLARIKDARDQSLRDRLRVSGSTAQIVNSHAPEGLERTVADAHTKQVTAAEPTAIRETKERLRAGHLTSQPIAIGRMPTLLAYKTLAVRSEIVVGGFMSPNESTPSDGTDLNASRVLSPSPTIESATRHRPLPQQKP